MNSVSYNNVHLVNTNKVVFFVIHVKVIEFLIFMVLTVFANKDIIALIIFSMIV